MSVSEIVPDWTLHWADCAQAALLLAAAGPRDLAIVDVTLPGDDGFALLKQLTEAAPGLRVILISGRADAAVRSSAQAAGAAGFIAKTEPPETIVAAIETVTDVGALAKRARH